MAVIKCKMCRNTIPFTPGATVVNTGWWWLRSPGIYHYYAAIVLSDGSLRYGSVYDGDRCVRPALWVNLESGIF